MTGLLRRVPKSIWAILAGIILSTAFSPFNYYVCAWIAPFILLCLWRSAKPREATAFGFWFGVAYFGFGVSWIFISIHVYGQTPVLVAEIITALFVIFLACFYAMQGYLLTRFWTDTPIRCLIVFPTIFTLLEYTRSHLFSGFPWLLLSQSQTQGWFSGYVPILGEFGLTALMTFTMGLLYLAYYFSAQRIYALFGAVAICMFGAFLQHHDYTHAIGKPITVSLVQPNIDQNLKWQATHVQHTLNMMRTMTQPLWSSEWIIWPEAAIPTLPQLSQPYLRSLERMTKQHHRTLLFGIPMEDDQKQFYNAMMVLGNGSGIYQKRHLVPFGEYLPFYDLLHGLIGFFDLPMSDFSSGAEKPQPLLLGNNLVAPFICYEIAYAELARTALPQSVVLITLSNDGWFGDSFAPWQHLQIGQFRALQTGRYLLFANNTGVTAIVDVHGKIIQQIPRAIPATLTGQFVPLGGSTPWVKYGDTPIIVGLGLLLGIACAKASVKKCSG